MATTPPPSTRPLTPPAPIHGPKYDKYEAFKKKTPSKPRRHRATQTPPPATSSSSNTNDHESSTKHSARISVFPASPPPSIYATPQTSDHMNGSRKRLRDGRPPANSKYDVDSLGHSPSIATRLMTPGDSLPTPAKTPSKPSDKKFSDVEEAARVLFPSRPETVEEMMPTPKKRRTTKQLAFSLDSFEELSKSREVGEEIPIFTDWKEREPETSAAAKQGFVRGAEKLHDPFVDDGDNKLEAERAHLSKTRKRKPKLAIMPDGSEKPISELVGREDGLLKDFRGKTFFQPFAEGQRSSYQPVSLWPGTLRSQASRNRSLFDRDEDVSDVSNPEEQVTDIDEDVAQVTSSNSKARSRQSPFATWPRTKPTKREVQSHKQERRSSRDAGVSSPA